MPNSNNLIQKTKNTVSDLNEKTIQQASIMGDVLDNSVPNVSRLADISDIGDIEDITVNYTGSNNLYLLISTDGSRWYSYRDELNISKYKVLADKKLVAVDTTNRDDIKNKAMSYSLFNDLTQTDWSNIINNSDQVSFAYYLEDQENNDITKQKHNISISIKGKEKDKVLEFEGFEELNETDEYALKFDGYDDGVTLNNKIQGNYKTIEGWFYVSEDITNNNYTGKHRGMLFAKSSSYNPLISLGQITQSVEGETLGIYDGSHLTYIDNIINKGWNHFAFVWNGSYYNIYLNGNRKNIHHLYFGNTNPCNLISSSFDEIGFRGARSQYTEITFDEIRFWETSRTQTEINNNMSVSLTGNETGLIAYYPIKQGSGNIIKDYSKNNNDGTISGAVWELK